MSNKSKSVFKVEFEEVWTWGSAGKTEENVVAADAEAAIAKVKSRVGTKEQVTGDDDKPVKGKFDVLKSVKVSAVNHVCDIDVE